MPPTQLSARLRRSPSARLVAFLILLALGATALSAALYLLRFPAQRSHGVLQPWPLLATGVFAVGLVLAVTTVCLRWIESRPLATIGLPARPFFSSFTSGLALGTIVPGLVTVLLGLFGRAIIHPNDVSVGLLLGTTLPMVGATILLSSWEELAFRGYPLQLLVAWAGQWPAALVTGVLFGLAHGGNPGANVVGFLNTATNGVLLAWIVMRTGSLWFACGYHAGWNLMASQVLGLVDSGVQSPGSLFATQLNGPDWVAGGGYGFEASVLTGMLEVALLGVLVWQAPRLPRVEVALPHFGAR